MFSATQRPLNLALLLSLVFSDAFANPTPKSPNGFSMNLKRRSSRSSSRTAEELGAWAKANRDFLMSRYGGPSPQRRSAGTNLLVNQNYDSSFYGSLAIGTPAVSYNVILDTGSADLWVAASNCSVGCDNITGFDPSTSSSYTALNKQFSITYGSGSASGILGEDVVQMAGFSVSNQVFGICDQVDSVLESPVAGLLGLGFQSIATSGAAPLWETLVKGGAWDDPVMSFQLTRYVDDSDAESLEPGGTFTMGFVNSSLYTGDIEYNDIPDGQETYWIQTLTGLTAQGSSISLGSGTDVLAAIDTGTTAIGGPQQYITDIYAQIPGSAAATGQYEGYYTYPCSTTVKLTMSFGGKSWAVSNENFQIGQLDRTTCLGALFSLTTGSSAPSWIIGDSFLKNVYSVFRFDPASVGFAQLSDYALSLNGQNGALPSATIGSVAAQVSATGGTRASDGASSTRPLPGWGVVAMAMLLLSSFFLLS